MQRVKYAKGNRVKAPPGFPLSQAGPIVDVSLSMLEGQVQPTNSGNKKPPQPVAGKAIIDTGASVTCFDQKAAAKAGLMVFSSGPLHSATHANEIVPIYAGSLLIHDANIHLQALSAYGTNLEEQNLIALIGRDALAQCVFIYNGPISSFPLSI